jgi:hypothetical protein
MRGASESWKAQQDAVIQAYVAAVEAGETEKAAEIKAAHPDVEFTVKTTEG